MTTFAHLDSMGIHYHCTLLLVLLWGPLEIIDRTFLLNGSGRGGNQGHKMAAPAQLGRAVV